MISQRDPALPVSPERDKPRVLQVGKFYPPYMGGIETHLQTLCVELRDDVDLEVVVANVHRASQEEHVDGIPVARLGSAFSLAAAPVCPGLGERLRTTPADIVHVHLPNPAAVLTYLAGSHKGRLIVSYHSDVVRQKIMERLFRPFLVRFLRRADAIIVATPNHIDSSPVLREHRDRCTVIPYGIRLPEAGSADAGAVRAIREKFGPRMVLAVGRLVYYKGFDYLIRAMKQVSDAHLVIIGDGPLRAELGREAETQGVADRVTFLGRVEDLDPYYEAADLFVLPSVARSEAFGIVQLEAMACGTPVVNTSLDTGVPYVSLDGVSGLTVKPRDVGALSGAINRLLDDGTLRDRLGEGARVRAHSEFSKEVMGRRTLDLYASVLSRAAEGLRAGIQRAGGRSGPVVHTAVSFTDSAT